MTASLDPRIASWFGEDEHPERSWELLHTADRRVIESVALGGGEDPGYLDAQQYQDLPGDDRRRRMIAIERWTESKPYVRTTQLRAIERALASFPSPRPDDDPDLLDVPLITGPPGSGKTYFLKRARVRALCGSAWDRRLALDYPAPTSDRLIVDEWRPVMFRSMDGNLRPKQFFRLLCEQLGAPTGDDPQRDFERAVRRHGVQWLFLDEMQMVNFDGQYGRYLQDALKALQNMGLRLVLCGHNMRSMLGRQRTAAQLAAREQFVARVAFLDINRYPRDQDHEVAEWRFILRKLEARLRLSGHQPCETVLSEQFEEFLWVTTLGYVNALTTLVTKATVAASKSPGQRLTERVFNDIRLNERVQPGRGRRLDQWRANTFLWSTDVKD